MKSYEMEFYKEFMRQDGYYLVKRQQGYKFRFVIFEINEIVGLPWLSISENQFNNLVGEPSIHRCWPEKAGNADYYRIS